MFGLFRIQTMRSIPLTLQAPVMTLYIMEVFDM
jgi:hypothetical protein